MRLIKILILAGVAGFAFQWWKSHESAAALAAATSPNGFVSVVMPDGAPRRTVVILAPVNCPSDAAQRADELSARLTELGIPNIRSASFSANINDATDEQRAAMNRSLGVLNGEVPAVFVNGMGKSNPSAEEVVAEYRRSGSGVTP